MQLFDQLTSRPKFIAAGLAVLVGLWLLSGILGKKIRPGSNARRPRRPLPAR